MMMKYNENGRSMVEMLGVLAIIGVLSVGGIAGYSKAMNKYKINKTTDQVSMLVANIRTLFSTQGNYRGLSNSQAKKFGVVPNDMYTNAADENIKNAFNGDVVIASARARKDVNQPDAFIVAYDGLSNEACVTIATGDWGSGQASGLIGIAAGEGAAKDLTGADATKDENDAPVDATGVSKMYVDDNSHAVAKEKLVIAAPGGSSTKDSVTTAITTPISVTYAVQACTGGGSGNAVAWKYY